MDNKDEGVSEEFKRAVESLCKRLEPNNKENNALWHLIKEICEDEKNEDT